MRQDERGVPPRRPPALAEFTLMENVVAISIIGMLTALLRPAVQASRESGRRLLCADHLRQQGLAIFNQESAFGRFP